MVRWTDTHCHVAPGPEGDATVAEAREAGVERLIVIGTDVDTSTGAIEVASAHRDTWATVGLHPHEASRGLDGIAPLLDEPGVVAVGECGLDYHYEHSPRSAQREAFAAQIALAHAHDLALVIHSREAWDDTFDVLGAEGVPSRTVFHCFTGGPGEARRALDAGAVLSFSGIITFKGANDVRAAVAVCPLDRLVVETDSPYLAPVPHRGQPNRPAWVGLVGEAVAEVKGVAPDHVVGATWATSEQLFRLV